MPGIPNGMMRNTIDLPPNLFEAIGRVTVLFAYLEWRVNELLYALLDVNAKLGRVAVANPRVSTRFDRIRDLLKLWEISPAGFDLGEMRNQIHNLANERDELAHGIWQEGLGHVAILRRTSGSRPNSGWSNRLYPEGHPITVAETANLVTRLLAAINRVGDLHAVVEAALDASPHKQRWRYRSAYVRPIQSE